MKSVIVSNKEEYINRNLNLEFDDYLLKMKQYAIYNNVPIIEDSGIAFLINTIRLAKVKNVLEIGSAIGFSASCIAKMTNALVTTIEINEASYNICQDNIKNQNLESKIRSIHKDALEAYDDVKDQKYDLIFIDAAKGQYINFFELYENLLSDNGVIVTDNLYFHNLLFESVESRNLKGLLKRVDRYNKYLVEKEGYHTTILNIGDGIGISIKK